MIVRSDVWLTVTGDQTDAEGRSDRNKTACRALYEIKAGIHIFTYKDIDPETGRETQSRMEFADAFCRITRSGAVCTSMCFRPLEELESEYETGFGTILMKIYTKRLAMRQVGDNFHARVSYTLYLQGGDPIECAVTVKAESL